MTAPLEIRFLSYKTSIYFLTNVSCDLEDVQHPWREREVLIVEELK